MSKKILFFLVLLIILFLGFGFLAISQTETPDEVTEAINLDEDVQPEDLEIGEPTLLPDHPLYFLKNWVRSIRSFFAFRPVTKAELRLEFANEKLMEVKKMIERKKDPEDIKKGIENYQEEVEEIKNQADRIREKAKENPKVENFLDKFLHQQTLHQKLLARLEEQVPEEAFEKIKQTRERHLERFKDVMLKLEDRKEKITEKLDEVLEKQKGSKYKHFKNLEILLDLEEKVPEEAKEAIRRAQENSLKRLKGDLEKMSPEDQEKFKEYIEKISGEGEKHLEIMENLKSEIPEMPELREKLEEGKVKIIEKARERLEKIGCPPLPPLPRDFCKEGRIIMERDPESGCLVVPRCIIPGEIEIPKPVPPEGGGVPKPTVCITLWNPVCGTDGKTYSNECFARLAEVEVDYKGVCKERKGPLREIPPPLPERLQP